LKSDNITLIYVILGIFKKKIQKVLIFWKKK
jgi:hypothetical protein